MWKKKKKKKKKKKELNLSSSPLPCSRGGLGLRALFDRHDHFPVSYNVWGRLVSFIRSVLQEQQECVDVSKEGKMS